MDAQNTPQSQRLDEFESGFVDHCMSRYSLSREQALLALTFHIDEGMEESDAVKEAIRHSRTTII